jgi:hypothetical protein
MLSYLFCLHMMIGDAGTGLAPHGPVQSDPIQRLKREFKTTLHICAPNLREKPCPAFK